MPNPLRMLYGDVGAYELVPLDTPSPKPTIRRTPPARASYICPRCETGTLRAGANDCYFVCDKCTYNERICAQCGCRDLTADHASYLCMQCGRTYDGEFEKTFEMHDQTASFRFKLPTSADQPLEHKHEHLTSFAFGARGGGAKLALGMDSAAQRRDSMHETFIQKYCNLLDAGNKLRAKALAVSEMLSEEARRQKRRFNCPDVTAAAVILACAGVCNVHYTPTYIARMCEVRLVSLNNKYRAVLKFMRKCKPISREIDEKPRPDLLKDKIMHIARIAEVPLYIADYACDVVCKHESVRQSSSRISTLALVALRRAIDTIPFKYVPKGERQFKMSTKDLIAKCGESVVPSTVSNLNKQLFAK